MAPNGGHLLVGKTIRLFRLAVDKATRVLRDKLPQAAQPFEANAEPVYARISSKQSVNRISALRQGQSRSFSTKRTTVRHFTSTSQNASKPLRSSYPPSRTGQRVSQLTSRAPFATTLRPNLTGGALSRTAGGYNLGAGRINGVRYFSHSPASPAEVVQNVSQAVRAFWLSGQKAHFDGYSPKTGEKRYRAISTLQDKARQKLDMSYNTASGSFVDFKVSPTITAIGPLSNVPRCSTDSSCSFASIPEASNTITNTDLISSLEVDFSRALRDLAAIMNDLKHLATLGSLPLTLIDQTTLRVRFPGCDQDTVEGLCRELNIRRGIVGQDPDFDMKAGTEMALMFPFAPSHTPSEHDYQVVFENENHRPAKRSKRQPDRDHVDWQGMMSDSISPSHHLTSHDGLDDAEIVENPWLSSPSGYSSLHPSDGQGSDVAAMFFHPAPVSRQFLSEHHSSRRPMSSEYEGLEGIHKFIQACDGARR